MAWLNWIDRRRNYAGPPLEAFLISGKPLTVNVENLPEGPTLRPRQTGSNDCAIAVYREITGEDANTAFASFDPHMKGQAGFSREALSACL